MSSPTAPAYNWIKQIPPTVMQWEEVPLYGASPAFPWEELSAELSKLFQLEGFKISHKETEWRNPDRLTDGLGSQPLILPIGVANIEGTLTWAMSKSDISLVMEKILNQAPDDFVALDKDFFTGFYHYLAAQTFYTLSSLDFGKNLNAGIIEGDHLPSQACLCLDVEIALANKKATGRLIVSPEALTSWKQRWADRSLSTALESPLAEKLQAIVHLEIGNVALAPSEWKEISLGDFFDSRYVHL